MPNARTQSEASPPNPAVTTAQAAARSSIRAKPTGSDWPPCSETTNAVQ